MQSDFNEIRDFALIEKHSNFIEIDQLKDEATFENVAIGDMEVIF
jgi:hypothetical protein